MIWMQPPGNNHTVFHLFTDFFWLQKFILIMIKCVNFKRNFFDIQNCKMKTENGWTCSTSETETKLRTGSRENETIFILLHTSSYSQVAFTWNCGSCVMALKASIKWIYLYKYFNFHIRVSVNNLTICYYSNQQLIFHHY